MLSYTLIVDKNLNFQGQRRFNGDGLELPDDHQHFLDDHQGTIDAKLQCGLHWTQLTLTD